MRTWTASRLRVVVTGLTLLAGLTAGAPPTAGDPAPAEKAVWAADRAFAEAAAARAPERFGSMILPEGIYLGERVERGRDAFVAYWEPLFDAEKDVVGIEWEPLAVEVAASAELAYSIGRAEIRFRRSGSSEIVESPGHYLTVWRPNEEGAWKIWASASLVVHLEYGLAHEPRYGLSRAWNWPLLNAPDAEIDMDWRPEVYFEAESEDLAVSFGRYQVEARRRRESRSGGGGFLAVRKKDEKGRWALIAEGFTPPI